KSTNVHRSGISRGFKGTESARCGTLSSLSSRGRDLWGCPALWGAALRDSRPEAVGAGGSTGGASSLARTGAGAIAVAGGGAGDRAAGTATVAAAVAGGSDAGLGPRGQSHAVTAAAAPNARTTPTRRDHPARGPGRIVTLA